MTNKSSAWQLAIASEPSAPSASNTDPQLLLDYKAGTVQVVNLCESVKSVINTARGPKPHPGPILGNHTGAHKNPPLPT